jgi:hypothetical protein
MNTVFFCQSCGARFEVDARMAGKKGRCKNCGQHMTIPRSEEIASLVGIPALAASAVAKGAAASAATASAPVAPVREPRSEKISLAPITVDRMRIGRRESDGPAAVMEDSKPYALAKSVRDKRGRARSQDRPVLRFWRRQLGRLQKLLRNTNQAAYLISTPFIMLLVIGAVAGSRPMAFFGAIAVVLLNIGRLVTGVANLAVVPFRDGLDFQKMKKPAGRVIEPLVTIGLVILAFVFIPSLSSGESAKGNIADRIRTGAGALRKEMKGEVDKVVDFEKLGAQAQEKLKELGDKAKDIDLNKLGAQAQEKLKELGDKAKDIDVSKLGAQAQDKLKGLGSSSTSGPPKQRVGGRIRSGIEALEKRTQEELDKAKALNEQPQQQP